MTTPTVTPATDEEVESWRPHFPDGSKDIAARLIARIDALKAERDAERAARERAEEEGDAARNGSMFATGQRNALIEQVEKAEAELAAVVEAMHGPTMQAPAERVKAYVETCARLGLASADDCEARREAETQRDAAVARNIILHQQMTEQAARDAADRIPVADWTFRFFAIFDEAVERIGRSRGPDEWSAKLLENVRTRIADLPGWNGSEGCLPSAFMLRDEHDRLMSEATARAERAEGLLARAANLIHGQELDRDFGDKPSAVNLEARAILADCGYKPETCSLGGVIGYSGTKARAALSRKDGA